MKAAFARWEDRIAPVFDTARNVRLVDVVSGRIVSRTHEILLDGMPLQRASRLVELGIHTLVCGAISQSFQALIVSHGIVVVPFIAGNLDEIIKAWHDGDLINDRFAMPGCCGRGLLGRSNHQLMGWRQDCRCSHEGDTEIGDGIPLNDKRRGGRRRRIDLN